MSSQFQRAPDVMVTEVDGELVLLDPRSQRMFTLNRTGSVVWEHIEDGPQAVVARLVERFAVSEEVALADIETVLAALVAAGLLLRPT